MGDERERILIVGGVAGGASAAVRARRLCERGAQAIGEEGGIAVRNLSGGFETYRMFRAVAERAAGA